LALFLASIGFFVNRRYLKVKGSVVSKTVTDVDNIKNSLLIDKIMLAFYLVLMGLFVIVGAIEKSDDIIGILFLYVFILYIFYKRVKSNSSYIKNK
jgi:Ca2+/Na+ antiporter